MKVKLNYGKKFLSLVMALTIITALFPITANAYTGTQYGDLYYEINYDNTITITDCNENAVSVDIPAKINGKSVTSIDRGAFLNCKSLTSITIPNSVTSIGSIAFEDCRSLTSITIPNSVTNIGNKAFSWCSSLTDVNIPSSVASIGNEAFSDCTSLTSITVDSSNSNYSSVNGNLFNKEKTELIQYAIGKTDTHYIIPYSATSIGSSAFSHCSSLTDVNIPNSVISIGYEAFYGCTSLTSVEIPDGVTSVDKWAFSNCISLTSVTIPDSVTSIGNEAFSGCSNLANINVDSGNPNYSSVNGNLFNKDKTELIQYAVGKTDTHYTIPDSVTSIGDEAFYMCRKLTSVTIPDSVTSIGNEAFFACYSLTSINVDSENPNYSSVNGNLFNKDKTELIQYTVGKTDTHYTIPDSVTSIGNYAFFDCSLTSITISGNVTNIGDNAFSWSGSLTIITIPKSVTRIGFYAFYGCDSLTDVYYGGRESDWQKIFIDSYNDCLTNANIHYIPVISTYAWNYKPNEYNRDLALQCAELSAAMYEEFRYDSKADSFYKAGSDSTDAIKNALEKYNLPYKKAALLDNVDSQENGIKYIITHNDVDYNNESRSLIFVICRGTSGVEWYGNMDITGKSFNSSQKEHQSFQKAASGLEEKIGEYIKSKHLSNSLVVVTGHSRGAAVANLTAYGLTKGNVSGVDVNGVYGYTFACPSTTLQPDTSLKNIYNFCFADDFVPAFPLDAWGYGKHGETHRISAELLYNTNNSFKQGIQKVKKKSDGKKPSFDYLKTYTLFNYVPTKWTSVKDYYEAEPKTLYKIWTGTQWPMIIYKNESLHLYEFVHEYLATIMANGIGGSVSEAVEMISSLNSSVYEPITAYLLEGKTIANYLNDTHQMYTYYEALKTGAFDNLEMLPAIGNSVSFFSLAEQAPHNAEQINSIRNFLNTGNNAELLGWDVNNTDTWNTIEWNTDGNVETISFYYKGLSGDLDLSGFSGLKTLICPGNELTSLKISDCVNLEVVDCSDNMLEAFDIPDAPLVAVNCSGNYLDTEAMDEIIELGNSETMVNYEYQNIKPDIPFEQNDIDALKTILTDINIWDLSQEPSEWAGVTWEKIGGVYRCTRLDIEDMGLTEPLNISGLTELTSIFCSDNELGSISVLGCPKLEALSCASCNLSELNIENTNNLMLFDIENNYLNTNDYNDIQQKISDGDGVALVENQLRHIEPEAIGEYSEKLSIIVDYSDIKASVKLIPKNDTELSQCRLIVAEYDDNGNLYQADIVSGERQEDGSYIYDATYTDYYSLMLWDSIDGMVPICNKITNIE